LDNRKVLTDILFASKTGVGKLHKTLLEKLQENEKINWTRSAVDSTSVTLNLSDIRNSISRPPLLHVIDAIPALRGRPAVLTSTQNTSLPIETLSRLHQFIEKSAPPSSLRLEKA